MDYRTTPAVSRRTLIKAGGIVGAMQLASPFINRARAADTVKIGMVDPLTGSLSALAQTEVEGAKYAVAENSVAAIGSMSPSYSPPAFFRFLMNASCSVWP